MRTMKLVTSICWGIAALALVGIVIWVLTGTVYGFGTSSGRFLSGLSFGSGWERLTGPYNVVGTYEVPADGLDSVRANWIAGGVTVKPYDGNVIRLTEYAQRELNDDETLRYKTSGRLLTIEWTERNVNFRMPQKKLEVLLPQELCDNMANLTIDSTSGEIDVESVNAKTLKLDTISGSKHLRDIVADLIDIDSTSGSTNAQNIVADEMRINSISGSITVSDATVRRLDCDTTSGSKDLSGSFIDVRLKSISGRVSLKSKVVPERLVVDTTSGGVTVAVPNEGAITVYHSATSGKLSSEIPITMHGNDAQFRFSSISGGVQIVEL